MATKQNDVRADSQIACGANMLTRRVSRIGIDANARGA